MKKGFVVMGMTVVMLALFMGGIVLLASCTGEETQVEKSIPTPDVRYEISYLYHVPDSMHAEFKDYVVELTKAATQQSYTTTKSKNKGDVVGECYGIAQNIYGVKTPVLKIMYYEDNTQQTSFKVVKENLTEIELLIFESLGGR